MATTATTTCARCGKNLALVGRAHNCEPLNIAVNTADAVNTAVNKRAVRAGRTKTERRTRGAYPETDDRRTYMRDYMARRRKSK